MRLLVDTSVLIDHLHGRAAATDFLRRSKTAGHELWSSVVVRSEILAGMRRQEQESTWMLLELLRFQEVTVAIADRAGGLARSYLQSHSHIDLADYLIAATTMELSAQLATMNIKHFPMLPGLQRPYSLS